MIGGIELAKGRTAEEDFRIAAHEAGHAIVGWYNGRSIIAISIEDKVFDDGEATKGHVLYGDPLDEDWNDDPFARMVEDVAGAVAERLHSYCPKTLRGSDREKSYRTAGFFATNDQALDLLVAAAEIEAEHVLRQYYPVLVAMASKLIRCRTVEGMAALELIEKCIVEMNSKSPVDEALTGERADAALFNPSHKTEASVEAT
ncbi:hypothetical protein [Bradyrhizobium sp. LB11.1]|uniref:hypothetical protein n=1 Tax=Bradyrhizobium sp. LB11.1 TaxID=3156326 RepID=UPI003392EB6D